MLSSYLVMAKIVNKEPHFLYVFEAHIFSIIGGHLCIVLIDEDFKPSLIRVIVS